LDGPAGYDVTGVLYPAP